MSHQHPSGFNLRNLATFAGLCIAFLWLGGCTAPVAPLEQGIAVSAEGYDGAFKSAIATLREKRFVIDRQDYRFGRITTVARPSSSAFEVWKGENHTFNSALSSTTNDQQRVVTVLLEPQADAYELGVEVTMERVQDPYRILTGSTDGHAITGQLDEIPTEQQRAGVTGKSWRPVGRDGAMERELLAAIQARLNAMASASP